VASGKRLARLAADRGDGLAVVTEAEAPAFLAALPLSAFTQDRELLLTLERWGLRRAGEFAALPAEGIGTRLGQAGLELLRRTHGIDDEPLFPRPEPEQYAEVVELDYAIEQVEPLLFLLRPAIERLVVRLELRGKVVGGLVLRFALDPKGEHPLPVALAAPTREVDDLLALCRQQIEAHPPQAGIRGLVLLASPSEVRRQQLGLWDLPTVAPAKIMGAVAQVAGICGAAKVGRLQLVETHRSDAALLRKFEPPPAASTLDRPQPATQPHLALRRFRPPVALEAELTESGEIRRIRARGISGRVASLAGPWRVDAEWFLANVVHDTYDLSLEDGRVFLVGRDRLTQHWWLFGQFD
jgi:protein ImuB